MAIDFFWTSNFSTINSLTSLRIVNIYNRQLSQHTRSVPPSAIFRTYDKPTIICRDFNIHSNISDPARLISNTEEKLSTPYFDAAFANNFTLQTTPGSYTRYPDTASHRPSVIDLLFTNHLFQPWQTNWTNNLPKSGSDHTVSRLEIILNNSHLPKVTLKHNWARTNWPPVNAALTELKLTPAHYPIEEWFDKSLHSIFQPIKQHTPLKRLSTWSKPWWTPHLTLLRKIYHSTTRSHKKGLSPLFALKSTKNSYFKAIQKAKSDHWNDLVSQAGSKEVWKLHASVSKDKTQKMPAFAGATTPTDTNTAMIRHFFPTPSVTHTPPPQSYFDNTPAISIAEVDKALRASANNSAPGPDTCPCLVWKNVHKANPNLLPQLFTPLIRSGHHPSSLKHAFGVVLAKPKKPDYNSPTAYRIIVLLETVSKILERIMTYRLFAVARTSGLIHQNQTGSISGLSTADAAHTLMHEVRLLQRAGFKVSTLFLDIKGGFDNILPGVLKETLQQANTPPYMVSWIMSFLSNRTCTLLFPGSPRTAQQVQVGAPQGSPISPLLFCIYVKPLHNDPVPGIVISYVDDFAFTVATKSYDLNLLALKKAHSNAVTIGSSRNTDFSLPKTEIIHWRGQIDSSSHYNKPITLGTHTFYPGPAVKWLGFWFTPNMSSNTHFQNRIGIAHGALRNIQRLSSPGKGLTPLNNRKLATMAILPLLTYGASVFKPSATMQKRLRQCWLKALRWITNCFYSTHTKLLEIETATPPLNLYMHSLRVRYACRILNASPAYNPVAARTPTSFPLFSDFRATSHRHLLRGKPNPPVNWDSTRKGVPRLPIDQLCSLLVNALKTGAPHPKLALEAKQNVLIDWQQSSDTIVSIKPSFVMHLPRFVAGRIHQMRSGKSYLASHVSWFNASQDTICPRCETEDETLEHAILHCPAREEQRALFLPSVLSLDDIWPNRDLTIALSQYIIATRTGFPPSMDSSKSPPYELSSQSSLTSISKLSLEEEEE